jgi:hypothetical protein
MEISQMVAALITGAISITLFVYVSFTIRGKGPILSNSYLWASQAERKNMDVKAEYRLVSVVFCTLGIVFSLITIGIITSMLWLFHAAVAGCVLLAIYAIAHSLKSQVKNK